MWRLLLIQFVKLSIQPVVYINDDASVSWGTNKAGIIWRKVKVKVKSAYESSGPSGRMAH